MPPRT